MSRMKLKAASKLKDMIEGKTIMIHEPDPEIINELLSFDDKKWKVTSRVNSSVFAKCLRESREKSFVKIDKKFEKLKEELTLVDNPTTRTGLFGGRANPFIGCDTALKGKDKTIITLSTPSNPTEDSYTENIMKIHKDVPIAYWIDESKDIDEAMEIIDAFGIVPMTKESLRLFANVGTKGAEAGKRFREAMLNIKAKEVSKEDKKPIKQPCNPASRKFNKEFWR